jgi:hypothetical protein
MMCGRRWPVNDSTSIVITKITGGKSMTETKKTPSGKHGPCVKCGKTRFIADRDGRCFTCSRAAKTKIKGATTTPERGKSYATETLPASPEDIQKGKAIVRAMVEKRKTPSALDLTVKQVAQTGIPRIIDMMQAERTMHLGESEKHLAEAEKLGKAIVLLESL